MVISCENEMVVPFFFSSFTLLKVNTCGIYKMSVFPGWKISYELPSFPIIHTKFKLHYSQTEKKKKENIKIF